MGTWTPLITSSAFDGIKVDVLTGTTGLLTICLIVLGAGIIIRTFMNR